MTQEDNEPLLQVFSNRSVLHNKAGKIETFDEGGQSPAAKARLKHIKTTLQAGYLDALIEECKNPEILDAVALDEEHLKLIDGLVNSITSEAGRAVVALATMQLVIKSIAPDQSIRLHKGSGENADFSWREGLPMRVIDTNFITPILRKHGLVLINSFGVMMTRSLAENYPYSLLYKASIRGAKPQWLQIVELVEIGSLDSLSALKCLISLLLNKTAEFGRIAAETIEITSRYVEQNPGFDDAFARIVAFINNSDYSARIFEVSIHALFQVFEDRKLLGGYLKPLSQMRSANKKHGNIGDIEITQTQGKFDIIEAWDAKYGKTYLREELEELNDKLLTNTTAEIAGFITDQTPNLKKEIVDRIEDMVQLHNTSIMILSFEDWVTIQFKRFDVNADAAAQEWVIAIAECICQRRRDRAPIDEPTAAWAAMLSEVFV